MREQAFRELLQSSRGYLIFYSIGDTVNFSNVIEKGWLARTWLECKEESDNAYV